MPRFWNFLGWSALGLVLPAIFFANAADATRFEAASYAQTENGLYGGGAGSLPPVIDGDNLRVIDPGRSLFSRPSGPSSPHG